MLRGIIIYAAVAYAYGVFLNGARLYAFLKRFRLRTLKEYSRLACYFAPPIALSLLTFPLYLFSGGSGRVDGHLDSLFMKDCLAVFITQKSINEVYRDYLRPNTRPISQTACKSIEMVYNESVEGKEV